MPHGYQPEENYSSPILNQQMRVLVPRQLVFLDNAEFTVLASDPCTRLLHWNDVKMTCKLCPNYTTKEDISRSYIKIIDHALKMEVHIWKWDMNNQVFLAIKDSFMYSAKPNISDLMYGIYSDI